MDQGFPNLDAAGRVFIPRQLDDDGKILPIRFFDSSQDFQGEARPVFRIPPVGIRS